MYHNTFPVLLCLIISMTTMISTTIYAEQPTKMPIVSVLTERVNSQSNAVLNPFSISQYRQNYLLPFSYVTDPNTITTDGLNKENVDNLEAKYQLSIKLPVYLASQSGDGLYFGFTAVSFWQLYNSEKSKPFRETNYEPELFYSWKRNTTLFGLNVNEFTLGISHQSNGRGGLKSRSWNRVYGTATFSNHAAFVRVKAWYRLEEDEKLDPFDALGDDNPDITRYLGHGEIAVGTQFKQVNFLALVRNNLRTSNNKGSVELNLSYPISDRYEVLLQYFNGYGDSLIEYNRHQQRIGLGVQLTFL